MRKHDVRKWLHAILDLLPVILIPVFMIYSHRHDLTERTQVDIQYKYQSNEINTFNDLTDKNIYNFNIEGLTLDELFYSSGDNIIIQLLTPLNIETNDLSIDESIAQIPYFSPNTILEFSYDYDNDVAYIYSYYSMEQYEDYDASVIYTYSSTFSNNCIIRLLYFNSNVNYTLFTYTNYNEIDNVVVEDTNSDIMSVFMDDFNNAIDKYFNMGNVFNLGDVYQWFNTNIFGGNAPVVMYSVWNIVLYEFVMDLMFLLYGLFMWFIDMVEKIMDKPFKSIK